MDLRAHIEKIDASSFKNLVNRQIFHGKGSRKYNALIGKICEYVLKLSMSRDNDYRYNEVGVLVDLNTGYASKPLYGETDINVCNYEEYLEMTQSYEDNSLAFVHNHPNNSILSFNDLMMLYTTFSLSVVVAVGNSGKPISYAYRTSNDNMKYIRKYSNIVDEILKDSSKKNEAIEAIYSNILSNPAKYGLVIK